jgi:uncharacterized protein (DUF427 family)
MASPHRRCLHEAGGCPDSVRCELLRDSPTQTHCFWKGRASYYDVVVDGKINRDAAWYYPDPSKGASRIAGHVAFWHGVHVKRVIEGEHERSGSFLSRLLRR